MNRIKTITVIGAGAVGSFFLDGLAQKPGTEVWAAADGKRKERLEKEGIVVNGRQIYPQVKTPSQSRGTDLAVVCVKYGALPEAVEILSEICDEHTIIMSPMNGVDSEEIIADRMGKDNIIHSMMVISAERKGNDIYYNKGGNPCVHYGRAEGYGWLQDGRDVQLEALSGLFSETGLPSKYHENIMTTIWNKFALNISTNIAQAIIGCNYGAYKTSPYMNELGQRLCDELLEVARAKNVECTFDNQRALRTIPTSDLARFSTLQDIMAGRHTEIDMFCGTIVRMGKECGVATPFNEFAWLAIKALEEKNDGKIF